jgi:hypothetical protein
VPSRPRGPGLELGFVGRDLHGEAASEVVHPPHAEPLDRLRREPLIDRRPLGRVEVGGRRDDRQDRGLRQLAGGEQLPHVVEPEMQIPRQVQPTPSLERRHPARHRHRGHDLPLDLLGLHLADRGQRRRPREREFPYRRRFLCSSCVLRGLRLRNGVQQLPLTRRKGVDHVFDSSNVIM